MKLFRTKLTHWRRIGLLHFLLLLSFYLSAQSVSIQGLIRDQSNQTTLPGALVVIDGTTKASSTDVDGRFSLANVPTGPVKLNISYLGYEDLSYEITVDDSGENFFIIDLKPDGYELEEIIVSANLEGQQRALNQQRAADNIKNIISADIIARFPDLNVAESLQRVPGVNINRDNGEGSGVTIRGTPQNYTTIQINGEQIQSSGNSGGRSPELTMFPVDQLGSIEVTKTNTPDMDGDAIGGSVNMRSPKATRTNLGVKAELGGGYNGLSEGFNLISRLSLNQRFLANDANKNGALGLLVSGSFFQTDNGEDRTESEWREEDFDDGMGGEFEDWFLRSHDLRALSTNRTRSGVGATMDYQFNAKNVLEFRFLYSALEEDELRSRTRFRPRDGEKESPGLSTESTIRKTFRDRVVNRNTLSYTLDGKFDVAGLKITPTLNYSTTEREEDGRRGEFRSDDIDIRLNDFNSNFPQMVPANEGENFGSDIFTEWRNYRPYDTKVEATTGVARIDLEYPIDLGNKTLTIKTGYKYRRVEQGRDSNWEVLEYNGDDETLFGQFVSDGIVRDDFLDNEVDFGPAADPDKVEDFVDANPDLFDNAEEDALLEQQEFFYDAEETTNAAYLMAKFRTGKFLFLAGGRFEGVDVSYDAFEIDQDDNASAISGSSDYSFFLPNFQAKYELNKLTNLRFAYTRGYARPNFSDLVPSNSIDLEGQEATIGNPALKPANSHNLDLMFERYLGTVGILSGGLFYKRVNDFSFTDLIQVNDGTEFPGANRYEGFEVEIVRNGEEATVFGIELNAQTNLRFLPGALSGLGLYANYTYATSDAFTAERTDIRLPGQAPHTLNAAITYDWGGFSSRLTFNFQDESLEEIGGDDDGNRDVIRDARLQIDANASYTIKKKWRIYAEFMNITNAPQIQYFGRDSRIFDYALYSWWTRFGVSYTL